MILEMTITPTGFGEFQPFGGEPPSETEYATLSQWIGSMNREYTWRWADELDGKIQNQNGGRPFAWRMPDQTDVWAYGVIYEDSTHEQQAAVLLGRRGGLKGGLSTSPAKQAASRENGKRGGRPRKTTEEREMFEVQYTQYLTRTRENRYRSEVRKTQKAADSLAARLKKNPRITDIRVFHKTA